MKRRLLSLILTLVMVVGLSAGLGGTAVADNAIGPLFDRYLTDGKIEELFDEGDVVLRGYCGKDGQANVQYKIYRVEPERVNALSTDTSVLETNALFQTLRERYPDFYLDGQNLLPDLSFHLPGDQEYYAVKIFGNGEMEDYTFTSPSPWSSHVTIDGADVNLEELLIAAYFQGPDSTYRTGVTNVGNRAFFGLDGLMLVYLGKSVRSIGEKAFEACDHLSAINFPTALESIGRRAFYACDYLTFARLNGCTRLKRIEERAFCTCSRLTAISFPNSITSIGKFAFAWDHVLGTNQFSLPASLKTIETGAFAFCTHLGVLNELSIPASVTSIGDWAFACNFDIRELRIYPGDSALTINTGAFAGNRAMESVTFPNRVHTIGDYAFAACDKLERVIFGDRDGTETLHIAIIRYRAFDSLEETGLASLRPIADAYMKTDSGDAQYVDGSRTAAEALSGEVTRLTGVTPLKFAAFGCFPPTDDGIVAASETMHSFPRDVIVYCPAQDYSLSAYAQWNAHTGMNDDGTWCGYPCQPTWAGHFHAYGDPQSIERTCTQDGKEIYTCYVWQDGRQCGHVKEVVAKRATGHHSELLEMEDATCTEDGIAYYHCDNPWCKKPDYSVILPATGHDLEHLVGGARLAPTCLADGYARGRCPDCGTYIDVVLPAKGHNTTYMDLVKAPTCTGSGYYQGSCPDCGRRDVRQTVPALGHGWNEGMITKPATATTDGTILYICLRCGETKVETIPKTTHTHQYEDTVFPPTCTAEGYTRHVCKTCGDAYNDSFVPAGHRWDLGRVQTPATATTDGRMIFTCTVCGTYRYKTIPATGGVTPSVDFIDVDPNEYFAAPVSWAVNKGITEGTSEITFSPFDPCTRGQAVTFLYRAAGSPSLSGGSPFVDVTPDDYFYNAVLWAVRQGITDGTTDYTFSPYDPCSRAHIVTFLYRAKHSPNVTTQYIPFDDVYVGMWYTLPVLWVVERGITDGIDYRLFGPENICTRGHIVTFLYRDRTA